MTNDNRERTLVFCESALNAGDIDTADKLIRPLARFSRGGPLHDKICDLEERVVDALIERDAQ